jgi:hypothetical protein
MEKVITVLRKKETENLMVFVRPYEVKVVKVWRLF